MKTNPMRPVSGVLALMAGLAIVACSDQQAAEDTPDVTAATGDSGFDFETWDQYLGGGDSSQYSSLDQINRDNVTELELAWTFETGQGTPTFNPIVVDDVMYVLAGRDFVALDAATGDEIWRHSNSSGVGSRGVNYWASEDGSDRRLIYLEGGMMSALNADTGEPITSFGDNGKVDIRTGLEWPLEELPNMQTSNPGRVFEDLIIWSLPGRGTSYDAYPADIHAFNILTGELEWEFHVVPREGEFGADTWPGAGTIRYGGVHNWSESTVDEELGIVYIPTGTARFDFYGGNRHGDNLFGNSLLALDARTGERLWHFQTIHHDIWDLDIPQAPKLLTLDHDGEEIKAVVQAVKQGLVFVFDRETGEPLWPIEEREVPASDVPGELASPTQPFPTWPEPFTRQLLTADDINPYLPEEEQEAIRENMLNVWRNEGPYTPPSLQGTLMPTGHNGGTNWGGSAVDPENGRFFVVAKQIPTLVTLFPPSSNGRGGRGGPPPGRGGRGAVPAGPEGQGGAAPAGPFIPGAGEDFVAYTSPVDFMMQPTNGLSAFGPPWSLITAYDLNTGEIIWQVPNGGIHALMEDGIDDTGSQAPRGGPVATAGGLVFVATSSDRKFRARNADTGETIWEYDLPAGSDGVPAVYAVDGRQYVAIPVGGNGMFPPRLDIPPAGPGQYMAFALPVD